MNNSFNKRKSGKRPRNYKFRGNQHSHNSSRLMSASGKKLNSNETGIDIPERKDFDGYGIYDKNILFSSIQNCVSCRVCNGEIKINTLNISGLSEKFFISCSNCGELSSNRNSNMTGEKKNTPELNARFIYAMRCIGQGLSGAKTFCALMDLPPPVTLPTYNKIVNKVKVATNITAAASMEIAALNEVNLSNGSSDITVSGDGTWKTRGHTSLVGVCTIVGASSGKVIDTEVLSSQCKGCDSWCGARLGMDYEKWKLRHQETCVKNHSGSAGMMEVVGMCRMFQRSELKRKVRYVNYIGDGDCKTFLAVEKAEPYGNSLSISKIECVGHIQKRMGTRLRKRKQEMKGKKLSDGKPLSGKGRLTDGIVDKLTVYYANAIRKHPYSYRDMQAAIWAIFFHKRSSDADPQHHFCPKGIDSWCSYQKAVADNKAETYVHKNTVPYAVMDCIKDIFKDLSMPYLLKRCLGGHTQNPNESLNAMIWKFCPKTSGSGPNIVQIAVNEAVICFNDGQTGRLSTMKELSFQIGNYARNYASDVDNRRIRVAEKRALACTLEARRAKRQAKKEDNEQLKLQEGPTYSPGAF